MTYAKFAPGGELPPLYWNWHHLLGIYPWLHGDTVKWQIFLRDWDLKWDPWVRYWHLRCRVNISESGHLLAQMYRLVLSGQYTIAPYFIREWERELGCNFTPLHVKRLIKGTYSSSINSRIQEMSYKFLTRWYRTPLRSAQIYPTRDDRCWRGCGQQCTYIHIWWTCPKIKLFWDVIAPWIKQLTIRPIEVDPLHFLFHVIPCSKKFYKKKYYTSFVERSKIGIVSHDWYQWEE